MKLMLMLLLSLSACTDAVNGSCNGPCSAPDAGDSDGGSGSCEGVVCNTPPQKTCDSAQQLRVYEPSGTCTDGACSYGSSLTACSCQSDACAGDPCVGVVCNQPPANTCADAFTLDVVNPAGSCSTGTCDYGKSQITCAHGCSAGQCTNDPCAGKSCSAPPASYCADSNTLRTFATSGACAGGSCTYSPSSLTCQFGCAAGACTSDPCAGKSCTSPPATYCADANTLRSFGSSGACSNGSCTYSPSDTACAFGCASAACKADPCLGKSCNAAPAATCVGSTARIYSTVGTCGGGSCTYGYVDTPCAGGCSAGACNAVTCGAATCNTAPAAVCLDASRLQTHAIDGTCVARACSYQALVITCSKGCFNGACIAGSWTTETNPLEADAPLYNLQMVIDSAGQVHEVGCTVASPSQNANTLVYRHRSDIGWQDEPLDPGLGAGCLGAIALDGNGNPAIAYRDSVNQDLRFAWRVGGSWSVKELIATSGNVGIGPSLTFDSSGRPVAAFWGGVGDLLVATRTGTNAWSSEVAVAGAGSSGLVSDVRFDAAGHLHVAGGSYVNSQPSVHAVKTAAWQVDKTASGYTGRHALGFGADGVLSFGFTASNSVYVRRYTTQGIVDEWVGSFSVDQHPMYRLDGPLPLLADGQERVNGFFEKTPDSIDGFVGSSQEPDGRARFLSSADELITAPVCVPQCSGRTCGDDACGGVCGSCSGSYCAPLGVCSAWRSEEVGSDVSTEQSAVGLAVGGGSVQAFAMAYSAAGQPSVSVTSRRGAWGMPTDVATPAWTDGGAVALSPTGMPLFAYNPYPSGMSGIYHLEKTGWVATSLGSVANEVPGLEVDSAGTWHVIWTSGAKLTYSRYDGSWTHSVVVDYSAHAGWQANAPSLALDSAGYAHVLWVENPNSMTVSHSLHYANNVGSTWTNDVVVPAITDAGGYWTRPQIRVDGAGGRHLVWADSPTTEWYAYRAAGGSSFGKEAIPATVVGSEPSLIALALDQAGVPSIIVGHGSPTNDVVLYKRTGSALWTGDALPAFGAGGSPVIEFDAANKPHALYWDSGQLRYATKP